MNIINYSIDNELIGARNLGTNTHRNLKSTLTLNTFKSFKPVDQLNVQHVVYNQDHFTSRLPFLLREHEFDLSKTNLNKIFTSQWLDERKIIMGTKCNKLVILDTFTGQYSIQNPIEAHPNSKNIQNHCGIHSISINPSRTLLATGGEHVNDIGIYSLPDMEPVASGYNAHSYWIFDIVWLDDQHVVSGAGDNRLALWTFNSNRLDHSNQESVNSKFGKFNYVNSNKLSKRKRLLINNKNRLTKSANTSLSQPTTSSNSTSFSTTSSSSSLSSSNWFNYIINRYSHNSDRRFIVRRGSNPASPSPPSFNRSNSSFSNTNNNISRQRYNFVYENNNVNQRPVAINNHINFFNVNNHRLTWRSRAAFHQSRQFSLNNYFNNSNNNNDDNTDNDFFNHASTEPEEQQIDASINDDDDDEDDQNNNSNDNDIEIFNNTDSSFNITDSSDFNDESDDDEEDDFDDDSNSDNDETVDEEEGEMSDRTNWTMPATTSLNPRRRNLSLNENEEIDDYFDLSHLKRRRLNRSGNFRCSNHAGIKYKMPTKIIKCKQSKRIRALAYNPKRNEIAAISMNAAFHYFDVRRFEQKYTKKLSPLKENVCLTIDDDYAIYAIGSASHVQLLDANNARPLTTPIFVKKDIGIRSLHFRNSILSIGTGIGSVLFYDIRARNFLQNNDNISSNNGLNACISTSTSSSTDNHFKLQTNRGWILRNESYYDNFPYSFNHASDNYHAIYSHSYDPTGTRLLTVGGPLTVNLYGHYVAVWR